MPGFGTRWTVAFETASFARKLGLKYQSYQPVKCAILQIRTTAKLFVVQKLKKKRSKQLFCCLLIFFFFWPILPCLEIRGEKLGEQMTYNKGHGHNQTGGLQLWAEFVCKVL